jgi:hypothetical protein
MGTRYQGYERQGNNLTRGAYYPFIVRARAENAGQAPESVARLHDEAAHSTSRIQVNYPASKVRAAD